MTNDDIILLKKLLKIGKFMGSVPFTFENNNEFKVPIRTKCLVIFVQFLLILITILSIIRRCYEEYINYSNTYVFLDILEAVFEDIFFINCFIYSTLYNTNNWKCFINKINYMEKQFNYKSYPLTKTYAFYGLMVIFLATIDVYEQFCNYETNGGIDVLINHGIYFILMIYEFHSMFLIIHIITLINHRYNLLYKNFLKEFSIPNYEARLIKNLRNIQKQFSIISELSKIVNNVFGWHIVCFICSAVCITVYCIYLAIFEHHSINFLVIYMGFCFGYNVSGFSALIT